jgi:deoxyribodipyrimidine photo-lyase
LEPVAVDSTRVRRLNTRADVPGPVVYWMSRDQRASDNWALLFARGLASERKAPLVVVFCLVPGFLGAGGRHYTFMMEGLAGVELSLADKGIGFQVLAGEPAAAVCGFAAQMRAGAVVCDFDPLREKGRWRSAAARALEVPLYEVDAHNVVPCREASAKQEYGAYTIRPRIKKALPRFIDEFPPLRKLKVAWTASPATDWPGLGSKFAGGAAGTGRYPSAPGESNAISILAGFVQERLAGYAVLANDPNSGMRSDLSPYLHFGQLSAQRVALEVIKADVPTNAREAFLEELITRRELSDNFCLYNRRYDRFEGFPAWAQDTLNAHRSDAREYIYSSRQLERAETHDELWNAAQREMVLRGKMHGYLRMYWAKKILEWTRSPEDAMRIAVRLNDRYELDGRDPNGYAGIAWSIGGVHDRAWGERAVFGKIRYMSQDGCRRKFDVDAYIRRVQEYARGME